MLREQTKLITRAHQTLDLLLTCLAFVLSYFIKKYYLPAPFRGLTQAPNYYIILLMIVIIWYLVFNGMNLYSSYRRLKYNDILIHMFRAVSFSMLILILIMYVSKINDVSRIMLALFYTLNIIFLAASKGTVFYVLKKYRKRGYNFRRILVVGSKERAQDVINIIKEQPEAGFKIIGCIDVAPEFVGTKVNGGTEVIGTIDGVEKIVLQEVIDEVIFAMPLRKIENADKFIDIIENVGVSVRIVPDWQIHSLAYSPNIATVNFEDFLGLPTMALHTTSGKKSALIIKSFIDYLLAGVGIIVLFPLYLIIAIAIKIFSNGPVLFTQIRSGLHGRHFKFYKFRTMIEEAEQLREELEPMNETDGPVFKIKKDPRVIPYIGTFLRKTGLDELPQLINILKGEMSLVGPRPPIPSEVDQYDRWHRRRLSMKPGITCLWQTCKNRNEVCFDDWILMDLEYIDKWSLSLDFKIMFATIGVVLSGQGR